MFICSKCDAQHLKWAGRCNVCDKWGTLQNEGEKAKQKVNTRGISAAEVEPLSNAALKKAPRHATSITELDRVLGGGIVEGSLVLLSGEPGIGKSTLAAMMGTHLGTEKRPILYASGEESAAQLSGRLARLKCPLSHFGFVKNTNVEAIAKTLSTKKPALAIIDSVQTLTSTNLDATIGGTTLVRYATNVLLETAKKSGVSIVLIGQVTKDGSVAGPKTLEHLVDTVLILEGEQGASTRLLRASKNRFGSTDEVGVFEMDESGLVGVENPSAHFLEERSTASGSVITAMLEGSRVFLVEIQALVEKSTFPNPIRRANGFEDKRLHMLSAVLSRRAGLKLADHDIYINVVGGLKVKGPSADLAVCLALASAMEKAKTTVDTVVFGEIGLGGEVRRVPGMERRKKEAMRLGYKQVLCPENIKNVRELL